MKKIDEYNKWAESNGIDSRLGVNEFTDMDPTEFKRSHTGYKPFTNWSPKIISNVSAVITPKATDPDSWGNDFKDHKLIRFKDNR